MIQSEGMMHMPPPGFSADVPPPPQRFKPWFVNLPEIFMISVLVVGFNATIKLTIKGQVEEQKNKELEKEKLQTELAFLRNQVSPHFLMNTLNNIHALVDLNPKNAKESKVKSLEEKHPESKFMRVHRSYIVNTDKIATVERFRIVFDEKVFIPFSENYKGKFNVFLKNKFLE